MLTFQQPYPPSPPLSMSKMDDSSSHLNLEKVVRVYGNQPELLELILSSKVEEDRRRAEEAKLRRKELDYMMQRNKETSLPPINNKNNNPAPKRKTSNSIEMLLSPTTSDDMTKRPRQQVAATPRKKKREVQAITTIIETREFPYNDEYLWKNNGNTVHKKTGYRSIYYKCSNNANGCVVNKTVTFKENGQLLIKYRGEHLSDCNRIKHISDL